MHSIVDDNSMYIDLFDDDLYTPADYVTDREKHSNLRNTIRLQIMLAILFGKRVCVPEQWALSSLTFLDVFEEVVKYYEREVSFHESKSEEKTWTVPPPIAITFRDGRSKDFSPITLALLDRVQSGRRLCLDSTLSRPELDETKLIHQRLHKSLSEYVEGSRTKEIYSQRYEDEIAIALGGTQSAFDTARRLSKLGKYVDTNSVTVARYHEPNEYAHDLAHYTKNVRGVCFNERMPEIFSDERVKQFREFWHRSDAAGYGPADIAKMWGVSKELDPETHLLITKMGRYCMHRALSRASTASYGSTFYGAYSGEDDDFDVKIVDSMRVIELGEHLAKSSAQDFEFLTAKNSADYEPADRLPWSEIWREVAAFSRTNAWQKTRQELKVRFENATAEEILDDRFWTEVFDEINVGVHSFIFSRSQSGDGNFDVAMNFSRDLFNTLNIGQNQPAIKVIGTLIMLANMAGARLDSVFRYELKAVRGFRKAAKFENSMRNIHFDRVRSMTGG